MIESMQFSSVSEFFAMGGYAFNVWSVYGLFAAFFFINLYFPLLKRKQIFKEQKRRLVVNEGSAFGSTQANGIARSNDSGSTSTGENL